MKPNIVLIGKGVILGDRQYIVMRKMLQNPCVMISFKEMIFILITERKYLEQLFKRLECKINERNLMDSIA